MWSPGPIDVADPPIDIAAVNPWMLRMAGRSADGVHIHPLNTRIYLETTAIPALADGAAEAGRTIDELEIIVPAFIAVGDDEAERTRWREMARMQIAFYGSTPNYAFIFDQLDRPGTTDRLRDHQRAGDLTAMAQEIDDDLLAHFIVEGAWSQIASRITERFAGTADRVVNYFGAAAWTQDPDHLDRWSEVVAELRTPT